MYTRSDNIEIMFGDDNDIIEQLFESLLQKHEENLQNKMRDQSLNLMALTFYIMILTKLEVDLI